MKSQKLFSAAWPALLPLVAFFLSGCGQPEAPAPAPPSVQVATVEQRDVPVYSEAVGTLEADVNATISAQVSGYLVSRNYSEGALVTNGQVLFQIDDRTYKAALEQAEAKVAKTRMDVERYTPLAKKQAISQQELDDAIQANAAAVAQAEQARLNYEFCTIRSPVDGVAGLAQAQVGNLVGPASGALTSVTTVDPMRVYFSVSQQLMTQIMERRVAAGLDVQETNGAPLQLTLSTGTIYSHPGKIRFANNQINVKTGTIRLVGEFPNPNRILVPGMFVRVRAQIGVEKAALLVPQRAVVELQGRKLLAVVGADNKVSIRPVETGVTDGEWWVVHGKIQAGDKIVVEGLQKLRPDITVSPVPYSPATPPKS